MNTFKNMIEYIILVIIYAFIGGYFIYYATDDLNMSYGCGMLFGLIMSTLILILGELEKHNKNESNIS